MPGAPRLTQGDLSFRDLNKNGRLDPYEDPRRPIDKRVEDLLSQMTLEWRPCSSRSPICRTTRRIRCSPSATA